MPEVQTMQHEGGGGAAGPGTEEARRVEQGPHRVDIALCGAGWADAVAHVRLQYKQEATLHPRPSGLRYQRIDIESLVFSQVAAVLVLQGMTLQELFPPDAYFQDRVQGALLARGPFILLKGTLSEGWDPPLRMQNVVLAALEFVPPDVTKEEVLALLLKEVL